MTLVVNLFGGPGCGKSTVAASVFARLKAERVSVELVTEFAKELVWEGRSGALAYQPLVTATQAWRIHRLIDQVDVIVTDSPIMNALLYQGKGCDAHFLHWVVAEHHRHNSLNVRLRRNPRYSYVPAGRTQSESEARRVDTECARLPVTTMPIANDSEAVDRIVGMILAELGR